MQNRVSHGNRKSSGKVITHRVYEGIVMDATSAAFEVGYESASQFNREYSQFFGQPPMRDIKALRDGTVVALNAA
jgi:AraC-like DNA-binding protein